MGFDVIGEYAAKFFAGTLVNAPWLLRQPFERTRTAGHFANIFHIFILAQTRLRRTAI